MSERHWYVWCPESGHEGPDDGEEVRAFDAELAAIKWAERDDAHSADYLIVAGRWEPTVLVQAVDGGPIQRFTLTGESVPLYRARKVEEVKHG